MGKQHELLAVENDLKSQADKMLNETLALFKNRKEHLEGHVKSYTPLEEDGETQPDEEAQVVTTVPDRLEYTREFMVRYIDATISKEVTNTVARADIELNGQVIADSVPAQALLNLESRLREVRGMLDAIPTLDLKTRWERDEAQANIWMTGEQIRYKTQKVEETTVIVPATEHHPAQVHVRAIDRRIGEWRTVEFSGKITSLEKATMIKRCDLLLRAVKQARQRANMQEVEDVKIGDTLFDYILHKLGDRAG